MFQWNPSCEWRELWICFFCINGSSISVFFLIDYFWRASWSQEVFRLSVSTARMVPIDQFGIPCWISEGCKLFLEYERSWKILVFLIHMLWDEQQKKKLRAVFDTSMDHSRIFAISFKKNKGKNLNIGHTGPPILAGSISTSFHLPTLTTCSGSPLLGPTGQVVRSLAVVGSTDTGVDQIFAAMLDMVGWSKLYTSVFHNWTASKLSRYTLQCHLCLTPAISSGGLTLLNCWTFYLGPWLAKINPCDVSLAVTSAYLCWSHQSLACFMKNSSPIRRGQCAFLIFPRGPQTVGKV